MVGTGVAHLETGQARGIRIVDGAREAGEGLGGRGIDRAGDRPDRQVGRREVEAEGQDLARAGPRGPGTCPGRAICGECEAYRVARRADFGEVGRTEGVDGVACPPDQGGGFDDGEGIGIPGIVRGHDPEALVAFSGERRGSRPARGQSAGGGPGGARRRGPVRSVPRRDFRAVVVREGIDQVIRFRDPRAGAVIRGAG